jgi:hypothetical protein
MKLLIITATFCLAGACTAMHYNAHIRPPKRLYMEDKYHRSAAHAIPEDEPSCITSAFKNVCKIMCVTRLKYGTFCMPNEKLKAE